MVKTVALGQVFPYHSTKPITPISFLYHRCYILSSLQCKIERSFCQLQMTRCVTEAPQNFCECPCCMCIIVQKRMKCRVCCHTGIISLWKSWNRTIKFMKHIVNSPLQEFWIHMQQSLFNSKCLVLKNQTLTYTVLNYPIFFIAHLLHGWLKSWYYIVSNDFFT